MPILRAFASHRIPIFRLFLIAAALMEAGHAGTLSGLVLSRGKPVPQVKLILSRNPGGLSGIQKSDSAISDSSGRYAFKNLSPGRWYLAAAAAGYQAANAAAELGDSSDAAVADLILRPGSGVVKAGAVTGVIREDQSQKGIKGAKLVLEKRRYSEAQAPLPPLAVDSAFSDSTGRYAFDSLDFQAEYILAVTAPGREPASDSLVSAAIQQTLTRSLDMKKPARHLPIKGQSRRLRSS
jgi:hypothetical protein